MRRELRPPIGETGEPITAAQAVEWAIGQENEIADRSGAMRDMFKELDDEDRREFMRELGRRDVEFNAIGRSLVSGILHHVHANGTRSTDNGVTFRAYFAEGQETARKEAADPQTSEAQHEDTHVTHGQSGRIARAMRLLRHPLTWERSSDERNILEALRERGMGGVNVIPAIEAPTQNFPETPEEKNGTV